MLDLDTAIFDLGDSAINILTTAPSNPLTGTVAGGTEIEFRYITSTKKVEVWDVPNNEKILTSTNVMDASGRDINLVIGSFQNDLDTTFSEYNIENI